MKHSEIKNIMTGQYSVLKWGYMDISPEIDANISNIKYVPAQTRRVRAKGRGLIKFVSVAAACLLVLGIVLPVALSGLFSGITNPGGNQGGVRKPDATYAKGGVNYAALAAYENVRESGRALALAAELSYSAFFNGINAQGLNAEHPPNEIWEDENGNLHVSYPYDYVRVLSAVQFEITVDFADGFFASACGMGDIKVIVANITAYEGEYDENAYGYDEKMIVFIGTEGIYSCLIDGGFMGGSTFSSHKTLSGGAIEKDTTYPIRKFDLQSDYSLLAYKIAVSDWDSFEVMESYNINSDTLVQVSNDKVYSVIELSNLDSFTVNAEVEAVDGNIITLVANEVSNLKNAIINDRTEIIRNGVEVQPEQISTGDTLLITYDKYYDIHNPVKSAVSRIEICGLLI